jgi:hypothetical protein
MSGSKPTLTQEDGVWVIRLTNSNGKQQEYRCSTEGQARQLAAVLTPRDGATAQKR